MVDENTKYFINPTGRFVIGGPHGDSGLTGRKIIVDSYGGYGRHGGGAFSGKDCTKVDRSAAYAARYVAKNIVAAGLADKCEIQLSYAIGVAQLLPLTWKPSVQENFLIQSLLRSFVKTLIFVRQDHPYAGFKKTDLQTDSSLRTLWTYRCRASMGETG